MTRISDNDTMFGEAGADFIEGGTGFDGLNGGAGNDTYVFRAGDISVDLSLAESASDPRGGNPIVLNGMELATLGLLPTADSAVYSLRTSTDSIFIPGIKSGPIGTVPLSAVNADHWRQAA